MMIRMVGRWVFLLVPAHPGSHGQTAIKMVVVVVAGGGGGKINGKQEGDIRIDRRIRTGEKCLKSWFISPFVSEPTASPQVTSSASASQLLWATAAAPSSAASSTAASVSATDSEWFTSSHSWHVPTTSREALLTSPWSSVPATKPMAKSLSCDSMAPFCLSVSTASVLSEDDAGNGEMVSNGSSDLSPKTLAATDITHRQVYHNK